MDKTVQEQIAYKALARMNITWTPDRDDWDDLLDAIEEAEAFLRERAGNKDLDLTGPEYRGLLIQCTWYFKNNKRAEFEEDYRSEIISMRLAEGFGCGKEESEV